MNSDTSPQSQPASSTLEPTLSSSYRRGWKALTSNFWTLAGATILSMLAGGVFQNLSDFGVNDSDAFYLSIVSMTIGLFVSNTIQVGLSWVFVKVSQEDSISLGDLFEGFRRNYLSTVITPFLVGAITMIGFILLIIPGIILAFRLSFSSYLILDQNLQPIDAMKKSWEITGKYFWTLVGMALLAIPIVIGGVLLLGIGLIPAVAWIGCSFAALYNAVLLKQASQ